MYANVKLSILNKSLCIFLLALTFLRERVLPTVICGYLNDQNVKYVSGWGSLLLLVLIN
jgi:hypothetical protein